MNSPFDGTGFVLMWISFLLLMSGGIAIFFLWAIRARQFSDQDRARYLPLLSGIPPAVEEEERRTERGRQQP